MEKATDVLKRAVSRRSFLAGVGTASAAALIAGCSSSSSPTTTTTTTTPTISDVDILNFALNLEYLEAEYYLYAATGSGLSASDAGTGAGTTTIPPTTKVAFKTPAIEQYANEIAQDELNHVRFLRSAITAAGATPVARPNIDLTAFTALAVAATIIPSGMTFSPFTDENAFLVGAFVFEDVGVTAYHGAAGLISNKAYLAPAAGILAVEAYHAAEIRTLIAGAAAQPNAPQTYLTYANQISALRGMLGGGNETTLSINSIVAADTTNAIAFSRTTDQVLHIVYGAGGGAGLAKGAFFPAGLNGTINTTAS